MIRKIGPFTQTVRPLSGTTVGDIYRGLGREYDSMPGTMQHHDRVVRREDMGQKMTPKGDVRNKGGGTQGRMSAGSAAHQANKVIGKKDR